MSEIKLASLNCKKCGENLPIGESRIFFFCDNCSTGTYLLNDNLEEVEVRFYKNSDTSEKNRSLPFWVFEGTINSINVQSNMFMGSVFGSIFGGNKNGGGQSGPDLSHVGSKFLIFVPAFEMSLREMKELGKKTTLRWPTLNPEKIESDTLPAVTVHREDAMKTAEFIFLSMIIEQPELVRNISYDLELKNPVIYCF